MAEKSEETEASLNTTVTDTVRDDESQLISPANSTRATGSGGSKYISHSDATKALGMIEEEDPAQPRIILKVYPRRWIVLFVVALLNNANTMSWIAFAPIANHVDSFYHFDTATNYFSMVYMLCTIPVGIFAMWTGRYFGLRWTILIAAWANGLGGLIRLSSSFVDPSYRFSVGITGQAIAAIAYPFIMFLPTKIAAAWFPDSQRTIATTVGIMSNPLGVLMANLISPQIVFLPEHVVYINYLTAIPSIFVAIIATFAITRSEPKHPPTITAGQKQMDFVSGVKSAFTNKQYLLLMLVMGGGIGMFNCLYTVMQQLLCPSGYSNSFSGLCAALMIIGGVAGATASGIFVDKTKRFQETIKICLSFAVIFGSIFLQLVLRSGWNSVILLNCFIFGVMGLATYPVGLELAAECSFPVSETTSTGLIVLSGQVQSVIYVAVMQNFAKPLDASKMSTQVCKTAEIAESSDPKDFHLSNIIMSVIAVLLAFVLVIFFHPKYRRMEAEKAANVATGRIALEETEDLKELEPLHPST